MLKSCGRLNNRPARNACFSTALHSGPSLGVIGGGAAGPLKSARALECCRTIALCWGKGGGVETGSKGLGQIHPPALRLGQQGLQLAIKTSPAPAWICSPGGGSGGIGSGDSMAKRGRGLDRALCRPSLCRQRITRTTQCRTIQPVGSSHKQGCHQKESAGASAAWRHSIIAGGGAQGNYALCWTARDPMDEATGCSR